MSVRRSKSFLENDDDLGFIPARRALESCDDQPIVVKSNIESAMNGLR